MIFFNLVSYSPEYLIQEGVVVVTCNYRLGPFGFLCLPEAGIQGNAGMKDQVIWFIRNTSVYKHKELMMFLAIGLKMGKHQHRSIRW